VLQPFLSRCPYANPYVSAARGGRLSCAEACTDTFATTGYGQAKSAGGLPPGSRFWGAGMKRISCSIALCVLCVICLAGTLVPTMARAATPATGGARGGSQIACGRHHSLAIRSDGTLWAWGANDYGQLGLGSVDGSAHPSPVRVGTATNWAAVACGATYSLALRSDGTLWAWGFNGSGQLGKGDQTARSSPVRVGSATSWTAVACGLDDHSVALRSDGSLWAWGSNLDGRLGLGDTNDRHTPVRVGTADNWSAVSGGAGFTLALRSDGSLWAWGQNTFGKLGLGKADTGAHPTPARVGAASSWTAIAAGLDCSLATRSDGSLWSWGRNAWGGLGLGHRAGCHAPARVGTAGTWTAVTCGGGFGLALRSDGSLRAWGRNLEGELGLGDTAGRHTPVALTSPSGSWALTGARLACGHSHTVVLGADGSLWAWGDNYNGELGLGTADSDPHPEAARVGTATSWTAAAAGWGDTLAIRADGSLWAWGADYYGELGLGDTTQRDVPTRVGMATNWVAVTCGLWNTLAIKADGSLWAWGYNNDGQLGLNDTNDRLVPVRVGMASDWTAVDSDGPFTLALRSDGSLWAWGSSSFYGDLGLGDANDRHAPVRVGTAATWTAIAAGPDFSLATRSDGSLWAWGENDSGELGLGSSDDDAHPAPARVGAQATWTGVACSSGFSLGRHADGSLWAWGLNGSGQLGLGDTSFNPTAPTRVGTAADWTAVACGAAHTAALQGDGSLWAWGSNERGQLGLGLADGSAHPAPTRVLTTAR
jgi:alpha-tubulin suppressor-like RCC1 family protein